MSEEKQVNFDYAFRYFVNYQEKPEHVYFEHTYNLPSHKSYHNGYVIPAKYLFTVPSPNSVIENNSNSDEFIDVETVEHSPPIFYNSSKMREQVQENDSAAEFEDNWMDKIDYKDWNVIKGRLFRASVQIIESDYLCRLANKGMRDEAVKRNLMVKKTASRFIRLFASVGWESLTVQWLHTFLLEKLSSSYLKVYTDAFQCLETKISPLLLENMTVSQSTQSVRSRFFNTENQNHAQKKNLDIFNNALSQHKPKKIEGGPILILVPMNMGNSFQPNTRPHRLMTELSLLGTLITVTCARNTSSNMEIPVLLEQMINATIAKISEIQSDYPTRPIVLVGIGAGSLLACHLALRYNQKITAIICMGFSIFTMEGKISKANNKILKLKTPTLFIIGQNSATATVDEMEEFRAKLQCKTGLVIVGGADDHLRMNHYLKMKCSVTQSVVDRCISNEISEFLNEMMQPQQVIVSIISNSDSSTSKATVSSIQAEILKKRLTETAKKLRLPIIKKTVKTLSSESQLPLNHGYGAMKQSDEGINVVKSLEPDSPLEKKLAPPDDLIGVKVMNLNPPENKNESPNFNRTGKKNSGAETSSSLNNAVQIQIGSMGTITRRPSPIEERVRVNFARKTRGGRRPYVRRTIPPKRPSEKMVVVSSFSSVQPHSESNTEAKISAAIENLTPDSLLELPVVFADENDEDNVINDVSLASYQPPSSQ